MVCRHDSRLKALGYAIPNIAEVDTVLNTQARENPPSGHTEVSSVGGGLLFYVQSSGRSRSAAVF
jgi:hypothetical protein